MIVNRVWLWHFGQGIVATPDDFGARGEAPSHSELLDYVTSRFIESGWSIKKLHRTILLSRTYQLASGNDPKNALKDSKNAYLWKFNRRRLDAEEIRDSLLADSGNLDPAPGGEHPFTPEMTWKYTQHQPFIGVESLRVGGIVQAADVGQTLRAWWIGDTLGDLVVAPLLFVFWARPPVRRLPAIVTEGVFLACALVTFALLVFGNLFPGSITLYRHPYLLFPLLAWAALRFGQYGAAVSVFLVSTIATAGTVMGFGPFAQAVLADSLLGLQAFMGIAAATALVLGAAIAERNRAVDARDEFLSIASHELRTPLTALSLHVQNLLHRLQRSEAGPSREETLQSMETANRLLFRMAKLIGELLEVSRVATGTFQLQREEVDLASSVRESLARFEGQLATAGCRVEMQSEGKLTGRWDPLRLDQVIDNLISNAVKYGAGKPVEVQLSENGERVVLEVRDHGIGINPADQRRVFERFERAVSRRRFGGFGLGLWITRKVIEAHGGTIQLMSEPGLGSTFRVELPR